MYLLLSYIKYWLLRSDEHSIHPPFLFNLYTKVFTLRHQLIPEIEGLRSLLKANSEQIELVDFGAGSRTNQRNTRAISSIAKNSSSPPKFSAFLNALIDYMEFRELLELGTSLGLNSIYMSASPNVNLTTLEGDPSLCRIAQENFEKIERKNIQLIQGDINKTLQDFLEKSDSLDLVYIDANHRYEPSLNYFNMCLPKMAKNGVIIFDDIHWSKEMWEAWNKIKQHPKAILTIDIFECGLVFINPDIQAGDYTLKF